MFLEEDEEYIQKNYIKKSTSVSNNVFERKLYSGFINSKSKHDFVYVSAPSVGWFPKNCKKIRIKGFTKNSNYHPINYSTTYLGSTFSKARALKNEISKIIKTIDLDKYKICLVSCELHLPYLKCAEYLKRKYPNSVTVQFVPDLPEFNNRSSGRIYNYLKSINCKKIKQLRTKYIDKYVLFSKPMVNALGLAKHNNWIVNEGIASDNSCFEKLESDGLKHVVFIGKLDKRNGVDLIKGTAALFESRKDIVFDFYGIQASDGISDELLLNRPNICVHGFVKPSKILSILNSSDVLLSPRYPNEEYTKYSFPSKIFDYLSSHKPIVSFKLDCYPQELNDILIYPKDISVDSLAESINHALSLKTYNTKPVDDFLLNYSKEKVVKKVMELAEKKI